MWTIRSSSVLPICGAVAVALMTTRPCAAQAQCTSWVGGTSYKVLIDEVQFATAAGNQPALSLDLLQSSVEGALEKMRRGILSRAAPQESILYLNCQGRHPQNSEFDDGFVSSMANNHAILEFWGTVFPLGGGQHRFVLSYVMFPVASLTPAPSRFAATDKMMASKPRPGDVIRYLIDARADLPTYFTAAAGVQAYADRKWDQAVRFLCEARTRLKGNAEHQDLMNIADQLASKAAAELRKSTDTGASMLTGAEAQNYCAFATTR